MKLISLSQGLFAQVDDDDFEMLSVYKWYAHKNYKTYYAERMIVQSKTEKKSIFLHTEIMGKKGVDHIDLNGLNNQRRNLRFVTMSQNANNRGPRINTSSQYKGVSWKTANNKWQARIGNNPRYYLGLFDSETEAAKAYDAKAKELFGEFANLNFKG